MTFIFNKDIFMTKKHVIINAKISINKNKNQ